MTSATTCARSPVSNRRALGCACRRSRRRPAARSQRGLRPQRQLKTSMQHEVLMYAGAQKEGLGFDRLVEEAKMRMSRYQVTPNLLILGIYLTMHPDEKIKYNQAGPGGPATFAGGPQAFEAGAFRGLGVTRAMPFETSDESDAVQMLQRQTQVGEYYLIGAPDVPPPGTKFCSYDTVIFDEDRDQLVRISFVDVLDKLFAMLGDVNALKQILGLGQLPATNNTIGALNIGVGNRPPAGSRDAIRTGVEKYPEPSYYETRATKLGFAGPDGPTRAQAMMGAAVATKAAIRTQVEALTLDRIKALVNIGVWMPIKCVLARPFIEHLGLSCIVAVAGSDTGATLFGPSDMQLSANTSVKTVEGHYTMHSKAVVTKPQNVFIMRDVLLNGYIGGCGTQFFPTDANDFREKLQARLSLDEEYMGEPAGVASIMPIPVHWTWTVRDVVGVSDRILPWTVARDAAEQYSSFPGGRHVWATLYSLGFDLTSIHYGEDQRAIQGQEFMSNGSLNNSMCFLGPHRRENQLGLGGYQLVPGQGHMGTDALPGDARWRRGQATTMEACRSEMIKGDMYSKGQIPYAVATV